MSEIYIDVRLDSRPLDEAWVGAVDRAFAEIAYDPCGSFIESGQPEWETRSVSRKAAIGEIREDETVRLDYRSTKSRCQPSMSVTIRFSGRRQFDWFRVATRLRTQNRYDYHSLMWLRDACRLAGALHRETAARVTTGENGFDDEPMFVFGPNAREMDFDALEYEDEWAKIRGEMGRDGDSMSERELLEGGDKYGRTAAHRVTEHMGDHEEERTHLFGFLQEQGADLNAADVDGNTPMHSAAGIWDADVSMRALLAKGADWDRRNRYGFAPVHSAAENGSLKCLEELIEHGVPVDLASRTPDGLKADDFSRMDRTMYRALEASGFLDRKPAPGQTPLHRAAYSEEAGAVDLLAQRGADLNARDSLDQTPLHLAFAQGSSKCAERLEKLGADLTLRDRKGRTPKERDGERLSEMEGVRSKLKMIAWVLRVICIVATPLVWALDKLIKSGKPDSNDDGASGKGGNA